MSGKDAYAFAAAKLRAAKLSVSKEECLNNLISSKNILEPNGRLSEQQLLLLGNIYKELALESSTPIDRSINWKHSLKLYLEHYRTYNSSSALDQYAQTVVDYSQDQLKEADSISVKELLINALTILEEPLQDNTYSRLEVGELLARKSALIREQSKFDSRLRASLLNRALSAATTGIKLNACYGTHLETALVYDFKMRLSKDSEEYVQNFQNAKAHFEQPSLKDNEAANLARLQFYRSTQNATDACEVFCEIIRKFTLSRRILRHSYLYGEAVIMLWYQRSYNVFGIANYDNYLQEHLKKSFQYVDTAISHGIESARLYLCYIYLEALISSDFLSASEKLNQLKSGEETITLESICSLITEGADINYLSRGLCLGINQPSFITRLGTFTLIFTKDLELAGKLYRAAYNLKATPITALNLARYYIKYGNAEELNTVTKLISQSKQRADARFTHWRRATEELKSRLRLESEDTKTRIYKRRSYKNLSFSPDDSLNQLHSEFQDLQNNIEESPSSIDDKRGDRFEKLVKRLFELNSDDFFVDNQHHRPKGNPSLNKPDLMIKFENNWYTIECKCSNSSIERADIDGFTSRISKNPVARGVVIANQNYTKGAIELCEQEFRTKVFICLIGPNDIESVLLKKLTLKQLFLNIIYYTAREDGLFYSE
jgi:hypothetical protein